MFQSVQIKPRSPSPNRSSSRNSTSSAPTSIWSQELLSELIQETKAEIEKLDTEIEFAQALAADADKAAKDIKEQYDRILTWADMFEGSTLEGKKMIMWQLIEKVRIYRDYQFEVDLKPTVKEFKALWNKRSTQSTNGAA